MIRNLTMGITQRTLPTLADIQRRRAELLGSQPQSATAQQTAPHSLELWHDHYPTLSQARPGLHGASTSRAEAQILRLSALYAALDCSSTIAAPPPGCPRRMGLLRCERFPPLRHLHRRSHRRPYPRSHQCIHRRTVQKANERSLPRPRQQQPHRSRTRTTPVVGSHLPKQPAQRRPPLYPLVCDSRSEILRRCRNRRCIGSAGNNQ
jgi:hypothetical protein